MNREEFLKGTVSSLAFISLNGCLTSMVHETQRVFYQDTALSYLVTEDGAMLVVLGEKYHYIFNHISPSLTQVLRGSLRTLATANLSNFYVTKDNVVTGDYTLALSDQATEEERKSAIEAGFVMPGLTLSGHLEGIRYSADGFPPIPPTQAFTRPYLVGIEEERGFGLPAKILLTPVAVVGDALLVFGVVLLILMNMRSP